MTALQDKRVLITGSGRGIGKGIAKRFVELGAKAFLVARSKPELEAAQSELGGERVELLALDLKRSDSASLLIEAVVARWGGLDVLVANAGSAEQGGFLELSDEAWADGFSVKMFGNLRVIKSAWPCLKASQGSLVMIGGGTARMPDQRLSLVSAVNGGLAALSKSIAEQGYEDGIQVNLVQPGTIVTSRRENLFRKFAASENRNFDDYRSGLASRLRIRRLGEPKDVANFVTFLCLPDSRWMHGTITDVDGGQNKST